MDGDRPLGKYGVHEQTDLTAFSRDSAPPLPLPDFAARKWPCLSTPAQVLASPLAMIRKQTSTLPK